MAVTATLYNADFVDAVPAGSLRARGNAVARALGAARFVIRRKRDGRFLALIDATAGGHFRLRPLDPALCQSGLDVPRLLAMLGVASCGRLHPRRATRLRHLPRWHVALPRGPDQLRDLLDQLAGLGIDPLGYADRTRLPLQFEPALLRQAGQDRYRRPLWLTPGCAAAWLAMRESAAEQGVPLEAISGFRGYAYQLGIIRRKLARGLGIGEILAVNAAPGFSEHHSGRAIDIGTPGEPAAEESFESTPAFDWLCAHAGGFGFRLSYPRDNPHGIVHEPWHWYWVGLG